MGLVGLAEGIKTGIADLFHPTPYLLMRKGMAITQKMFVFASAIDENGLFVEVEAVVAVFAQYWPRDASDAKRGTHLVSRFAITLNHRREVIEVGIFQ